MKTPDQRKSDHWQESVPSSPELTDTLADIRQQFLSQVDTHQSREMILLPARWPISQFLCLRHRTQRAEGGLPLLGVIYDGRPNGDPFEPASVYLCNILDLEPLGGEIGRDEFLALPTETFSSVDELLAAGWIVD